METAARQQRREAEGQGARGLDRAERKDRIFKGLPKDRMMAIGASGTSPRTNTGTEKSSKVAKVHPVKKMLAKLATRAAPVPVRGMKKLLRVRAVIVKVIVKVLMEGSGHPRLLRRRARHPAPRTPSAPTPAQVKAMTTQNKKPKHSSKTSITRTTPATRS